VLRTHSDPKSRKPPANPSKSPKRRGAKMPGFHHHRHRFGHRGAPLNGAIWMIGLGVLMLTGHWWPGILVLIGISMVVGAILKESGPQVLDQPEEFRTPPPPPVPFQPPAPVEPQPFHPSTPVETNYRSDLLPANCTQCGGPIRTLEVKWLSSKSAACPYCGSTLTMKKN